MRGVFAGCPARNSHSCKKYFPFLELHTYSNILRHNSAIMTCRVLRKDDCFAHPDLVSHFFAKMLSIKMTYPCKRRFDIRSMGQWLYKNPGRPYTSDTRQWRESCNFVLNVVGKVIPCEGYASENGWLIL